MSSATEAQKEKYPIQGTLEYDTVLSILHDHSLVSRVFWPASSNEENKGPEFKSLVFLPRPQCKHSLSNHENGVICTEEAPLGFTITIKYTIYRGGNGGEESVVAAESNLYLEEERNMRGPRPVVGWAKFDQGPIVKTQNLLRFLEELSRNRRCSERFGSLDSSAMGLVDGGDKSKKDADMPSIRTCPPRRQKVLFEVKATGWTGGRYQWTGSDGKLLAVEDVGGDESQPRLVGQVPLPKDRCDALVAGWILRLWLDRAESRQAKRAWYEHGGSQWTPEFGR